MSDGGKGSAQRPGKGYEDNYDRIFGKKPEQFAGCLRCNTPGKCAVWGCVPNTFPAEVVSRNILKGQDDGAD